jgi:hypothetical protein
VTIYGATGRFGALRNPLGAYPGVSGTALVPRPGMFDWQSGRGWSGTIPVVRRVAVVSPGQVLRAGGAVLVEDAGEQHGEMVALGG